MSVMRKGIKVRNKLMYDKELIFSRVIGLQASSRNVDFKNVLSYELAPIPTALFDDSDKPYHAIIILIFMVPQQYVCFS